MAITVDETPNISLDMEEFTDKTPVHYDEMNSRHKQHLDNEKALLYPAFDDSGKVSGISSFNDFLGTIKSRMRLFDFLRNFKAGMQFVMHLGRAANNCTTTSEGLYLDARQGKVLMDLYTKLNSDLSSLTTPIPLTDTASINLDSGLFGENKIYFHTVSSERPKNTKGFPADAYGYGALITGKHNYAWLSFQIYIPHNNATNVGCPIYFRTFADTTSNNSPIWRYIEPKMVQANT